MWEFIVFITLEPQSVHNSGVWANHHRAGNNDQEKPRPIISLGNPIWPHFNAENGIDFLVKFRVEESREMENQREDPRTKNNNLKCEMRQPCWNAHSQTTLNNMWTLTLNFQMITMRIKIMKSEVRHLLWRCKYQNVVLNSLWCIDCLLFVWILYP